MGNQINIGDTLYDTFGDMIEAQKVTEIRQTSMGLIINTVGCFSENEFPESAIGASVFRSHQEATDFLKTNGKRVREVVFDNRFDM